MASRVRSINRTWCENVSVNGLKDLIPTRQSLLSRLKNWDDQESWKVFFDTYWKLIYSTAVKAGLHDAEAQDVVQDTVISVSRSIPNFKYDASKGSFKAWLLRLTGWRIADQLRKRQRKARREINNSDTEIAEAAENMIDPASQRFQAAWDEGWEQNLVEAAINRVKMTVDPTQYQIFDLYVLKEWPVLRIARTLKINPGRIYLAKHRISHLVKKELARLQTKLI